MKKTLKWIYNSHMFTGFSMTIIFYLLVFGMIFSCIALYSLFLNDWECFNSGIKDLIEAWNILLAVYIGFSLIFSFVASVSE